MPGRAAQGRGEDGNERVTSYYADELVTLYHGDSREILPTLASESVDFIFTDPPYGHNNNNGDLAHRRVDPSPTTAPRPMTSSAGSTAKQTVY